MVNQNGLSYNETDALDTLQTVVATLQEIGQLRIANKNYEAQHSDDAAHITILTTQVETLQAQLAAVNEKLAAAEAREAQLRTDLANSEQVRIAAERDLIDANAANVSLSGDKDFWYREALTNETLRRDAEAKFTEADTKLARFRDILGIPAPINPTPALESPTLDLVAGPVTQLEHHPDASVELPNPGFTPPEPFAPFPSSSGTYGSGF